MGRAFAWVLLAGFVLGASVSVLGQTKSEQRLRVTGIVTDGRRPLAGVTVSIKRGEQVVATALSDRAGQFVVPLENPGPYELETTFHGFARTKRNVVVGVGTPKALRIIQPTEAITAPFGSSATPPPPPPPPPPPQQR